MTPTVNIQGQFSFVFSGAEFEQSPFQIWHLTTISSLASPLAGSNNLPRVVFHRYAPSWQAAATLTRVTLSWDPPDTQRERQALNGYKYLTVSKK